MISSTYALVFVVVDVVVVFVPLFFPMFCILLRKHVLQTLGSPH